MKKEIKIKIEKDIAGQRIDKYLGGKFTPDFSRNMLKNFIHNSQIQVNGLVIKPHYILKENDKIEILLTEADLTKEDTTDIQAVEIPLDLIYEDQYLLVVNKPAGLVVHPAPGHYEDTLVNALLFYTKELSQIGGSSKPGIVHRLDKDTSGVVVVARDDRTHRILASQFKQHKVKKIYIAIVHGIVEFDEGVIDEPIARSPLNRKKMIIAYHSAARASETYYRVLCRKSNYTVVEAHPKTGRTHQIRVHMAHLGHPLLGDLLYSKTARRNEISRQALHAKSISFTHPHTNQTMEFESPIPQDIVNLM